MKFRWLQCLLVVALAFLAGCQPPTEADTRAPSRVKAADELALPTQAQPKLPTITLWLGSEILDAEIARTLKQITAGMMFRESMEENEAMLFVFPSDRQTAFWMKNTSLALSAAYLDRNGQILEIVQLDPFDETSKPSQSHQIRFVLEVKQGWFERHNVKVGATMKTEFGSLMGTFFKQPLPATGQP